MDKFDHLCIVVQERHKKKTKCLNTVMNRLFQKSVMSALPELTKSNVHIDICKRPTKKMSLLATEARFSRSEPNLDEQALVEPVIVVEWMGREWLIDGSRRINYWMDKEAKRINVAVIRFRDER